MRQSEKLRQLGLGVQLRKARENAGMSTRSVARAVGVSASSISRNELGLRAPDREEVSALCALYGIVGEEKEALLEKVGDSAETAGWLASGVPDELASLMVLEREAVAITDVQMTVMPGLTHTAEYARLILADDKTQGVALEKQVATRAGRQTILSRPRAPEVSFFVDESVLYRSFGDRRVLREQLEHLLVLQRRENVTIRVLGLDTVARPAVASSFSIYRLADGTSYVFVEVRDLGLFITEPSGVASFVKDSKALHNCALDAETSSALITKVAENLAYE